MSGQLPSNLTPEQGWAAMREILDREMPVRRRRRAVLWWLPLTVAAGLALALWFRTTGEPVSPDAAPSIASEASRSDVLQSDHAKAFDDRSNIDVQTAVVEESAISTSRTASNLAAPNNSPVATSVTANSKEAPAAPGSVANAHAISPASTSAAIMPAASEINPATINEGDADAFADHGTSLGASDDLDHADMAALRTLDVIEPLPGRDADGVVHESHAPAFDGIAFGHTRSVHPITPYVSMSGLIGTTQGVGTALAAGAGVRINRWLSATTGLGYQWMNAQGRFLGGFAAQQDVSNAGSPLTEMDFLGNSGGGTVIPEGNLANAVESSDLMPLVDRVNQWQWHVGLEGHLGQRWKLEAGYTLGWGTQVTTQYPIVDASGTPLESLDSDGNTLNDYGLVKSSSSLLYGGMAYAPVRWLEIFGRYAHDLGHYLDLHSPQALAAGSAQGNDKLSTIQVGVRAMLRP